MIKNQKNMPISKADFSITSDSALTGGFAGGDIAIIKKENITATNINGSHDIPNIIGPKGVIQSWPAQPTRKIIKKKSTTALHGPCLLDNAANKNANNIATRKADAII